MTLFDEQLRLQLETARQKRRELEVFEVKDVRDAEHKAALLKEADTAMEHVKRGCDLLTGARLLGLSEGEIEELQLGLLFPYMAGELGGNIDAEKHPNAAHAWNAAKKEHVFHWEFEFPEVFQNGGFSAFVGNPPFLGGKRISTNFGLNYLIYLKTKWTHTAGSADICTYFFLRSFENLVKGGNLGLIATNTIAQGDTREVGLDFIVSNNGIIYTAFSSVPWPGQAAVAVSIVYITKGSFDGKKYLDDVVVESISSQLADFGNLFPYRLRNNKGKSHYGTVVLGTGFMLQPHEAKALIDKDKSNKEVLFPFINGDDLSSVPINPLADG